MKTKIVYTCINNNAKYYGEQMLISAYSVKLYNPNANIVLITDNETDSFFKSNLSILYTYLSEVIVLNFENEISPMERSRKLKTSIRNIVKGDYLFVDTDTIITGSLSELDTLNYPIMAVKDVHVNGIIEHNFKIKILDYLRKVGWSDFDERALYFNSGVMFVKDIPETHVFYKEWQSNWESFIKKGVVVDQIPLAKTNMKYKLIHELDGIWNCQIMQNGIRYFQNAKIIHYYTGEGIYYFNDKNVYNCIRKSGQLNNEIKKNIGDCKNTFATNVALVGKEDIFFLHGSLHQCFVSHPNIWIFLEKFASLYINVGYRTKSFLRKIFISNASKNAINCN